MSSFVVSKRTINKVVTEYALQERDEWLMYGPDRLGLLFLQLNQEIYCLNEECEDDYFDEEYRTPIEEFTFDKSEMPYKPAERLKACHCLLTQLIHEQNAQHLGFLSLIQVTEFAEKHTNVSSTAYQQAPFND